MAAAASSSSSSSHPRNKYDVFLSFRGEDTRYTFTSHVKEALRQKDIETFMDDQLIPGEEISRSLLDVIEESQISLIIFSERYASSRWCLDELVKIFECKNQKGQIVIPVFYRIDPSHVRKQTGNFGELFSELEHKWGPDKMQTWRNALTEAANLSGFDSRNIRPESKLIKEVVNQIEKKLSAVFTWDNNDNLVGVESAIKEIESLLALGSGLKEDYTLGIWGIGGIGKTTIARAVFRRISNNFEGSCFLRNVREESERTEGLSRLRQELVSQLLRDKNVIIGIDHLMFRRLMRKKVLIILDDVTCYDQIKSIIESFDWLMPHSRIIITTRDKHLLQICGVKKIYEVQALGYHHALELFSRYAFRKNHPDIGYAEHSMKVINYANGIPLALEVLGRLLVGREKEVWESAINKLENILHPDIHKVLKISYDDLDDKEKNIFLDVACFFKGANATLVKKFLDECGFDAPIGISVLVERALVTIDYDTITMHDLLQKMGREIVRRLSVNDPGGPSRLWDYEDIINVLTSNKGDKKTEGICLDMRKINEVLLNPDTFSKMPNLRFLKLYSSIDGKNKCKISHFKKGGFSKLRYFHWHGFPLKSLPPNIHMEELVSLELPHSNIEQLWNGVQYHGRLNQIIMAAKKLLTRNPIPNPSLTTHLSKLVTLNLRGCKSLKSIPATINFEVLKTLDLSDCSKLKRLPEISCGNLERMYLGGTAIEELPSSIECLCSLTDLVLISCKSLKSLPSNLCKLKSLKYLCLSGCSNLERLPDEFGNLKALESLSARGTAIREVPSSIFCLEYLKKLDLCESRALSWPTPLSFDGLQRIRFLDLKDCGITELSESLGQLFSLHTLLLSRNEFERIPESIIQLSKLEYLSLIDCKRLKSLPKLPLKLLRHLNADGCTSLESVPALLSRYPSEQEISLRENFKLNGNRIVEDALDKIQLKATARRKEVYDRTIRGYDRTIRGLVLLPGNEIPRWFTYQSMGSSVNFEGKARDLFNNEEVIGFVFCAVLSFQAHDSNFWLDWRCEFKSKSKCLTVGWSLRNIGRVNSNLIFLGYEFFHEESKLDCHPDTFQIQFYYYPMNSPYPKRLDYCPEKKCGVHLFFKKEEEPHPERSKLVGEEEPHPKRSEKELHLKRSKLMGEEEEELHPKRSKLVGDFHLN